MPVFGSKCGLTQSFWGRLLASEQLPKIMQEAELLKKLSHPNVVGFRGSVETPKHIHFVLEFVEGGSLFRVVKKFGTFTEKLCAIYMKQVIAVLLFLFLSFVVLFCLFCSYVLNGELQVLMGLAYLHEQGVVHRDIVSVVVLCVSCCVDQCFFFLQKGGNLLMTKVREANVVFLVD